MRFIVAVSLAVAGLVQACTGQSLTPTRVNIASGYTNPRVVGPYVLHGDFSKPVVRTGALVTIETASAEQTLFELFAEDTKAGCIVDLEKLPDGSRLLVGDSVYQLTAVFDKPLVIKRLVVDLSLVPPKPNPDPKPEPPKPDPKPEPKPDVPPDEFDNIGQQVAAWAVGLPRKNEVAVLYAQCATDLVSTTLSINACIAKMVKSRTETLKPEELAAYQPLLDKLNADFKKRYPMPAQAAADYFNALAAGLGGAK